MRNSTDVTRAVNKCDLILQPALGLKLVFCKETDSQTHGHTDKWTDGQTGQSSIPPKIYIMAIIAEKVFNYCQNIVCTSSFANK